MRVAIGSAIVLTALAIALGSCQGGPIVSPSSLPTGTPLPSATPGALPTAGSLGPGTYVVSNPANSWERDGNDEDGFSASDPCYEGCADYASISFTVPDGWATTDGLIHKHLGEPNEVAFSVWTPGEMYPDPCHWQESPAPEGFRAGQWHSWGTMLQNQAGREGSTPTAVDFGGADYAALTILRIELTVPADLDIRSCDQGEYRSWTEFNVPDGANSHHAAGQIDVIYLVFADRRPFLIDASHMPAATPEDLAELQAILDSIVIDRDI